MRLDSTTHWIFFGGAMRLFAGALLLLGSPLGYGAGSLWQVTELRSQTAAAENVEIAHESIGTRGGAARRTTHRLRGESLDVSRAVQDAPPAISRVKSALILSGNPIPSYPWRSTRLLV